MPDKKLVSYIREQLNQGFDIGSIRSHLISYDYSAGQVDDAIDRLYRNKDTIHISRSSALVIGAFFLGISILVASIFIYFAPTEEKEVLLDLELEPLITSVEPGQLIEFKIQLFNIGHKRKFDAHLTHTITGPKSDFLASKEEEMGVITRAAKASRIRIPLDAEKGDYTLTTVADYEGKKASSSFTFEVFKEELATCFDKIKNQEEEGIDCGGPCPACIGQSCPESCDDKDSCTKDYCNSSTGFECRHGQIADCTAENSTMPDDANRTGADESIQQDADTFGKDMDDILGMVKEDKREALNRCLAMDGSDKDECINLLALETDNDGLCRSIEDSFKRDSCYMNIAINKKDYSNCGLITNANLRESCRLLGE